MKGNKQMVIWLVFVLSTILGLSYFASVPFIYTILGFSAWAFVGHLVTVDDDMPGGFSNLEDDDEILKESKKELNIKLLVLVCIITIAIIFPNIRDFSL